MIFHTSDNQQAILIHDVERCEWTCVFQKPVFSITAEFLWGFEAPMGRHISPLARLIAALLLE
ncbi:MAG: hypothetical protein CMJ28_03400 [Phycisphaerae bacterium]|nr:hypothetical protein [Phycisphaerae bacterium]